jgi:hypothetical protein
MYGDDFVYAHHPSVASDGNRFLVVGCLDTPIENTTRTGGNIVGQFVGEDHDKIGGTIIIDDDWRNIDCMRGSTTVSWDGTNFLVAYIRRHWFTYDHLTGPFESPLDAVAAKRISPAGEILDDEYLILSTPGSYPEAPLVDNEASDNPVSLFDGNRHVVVWNQRRTEQIYPEDELQQMHGVFVAPDGTMSDYFIATDRLSGLFDNRWSYIRPDIALADDRIMIVWGPVDTDKYTRPYNPMPVYGQIVDLSGNAMLAEPLLIRADDGSGGYPRYPQVVFDGTDFIVAWIEGIFDSPDHFSADLPGVFARKVTLDGRLAEGDASTRDFTVVPEQEGEWDFLELAHSNGDLLALWSDRPGVFGARFRSDFAEPGVRMGVPSASYEAYRSTGFRSPYVSQLSFAQGTTTDFVVWKDSHYIDGWYLTLEGD